VAYGDTSAVYNISGVINSTTDFDAYLALTRDEQVPATVKSYQGAHVYNNFDTDASLYVKNSVIDDPAIAVAKDTTYAGRVKGGDFKWKFNNAEDDASYLVNNALKAAITNYKTSMVSIQGDSTSTTVVDTTKVDTVVTIPPADRIQNFTLSGKTSTFYAITGNLSTSYGSVTYAGLTLTQCLKIESSTNITFTTTQSGTLALVFNSAYSGTVKIDGTTYTPSAGLISVTIAAGSHTLIKGSGSSYLFYMSVAYPITGLEETEVAKLTLYPNPVVNSLSVSSDVNVEKTEIYSLTGVLVKRTESNIKTIDMSNLSKGCYLVRVYTGQGIIKQLIIKK